MKNFYSILVLLLFVSNAIAQEAVMEIYTFQQYKSEHTKPEKNRTTLFASGTQGDKVINVKIVTSPKGIVELEINKEDIPTEKMAEYKELTDFIADYAKMPRPAVAKKEIPKTTEAKKVEYSNVNDLLVGHLKADKILEEDAQVFDVMITYDKMFFNGKQQADEVAKKYKELYEEKSGRTIERTTYYHFSQTL